MTDDVSSDPVTVVVADDQPAVREGLVLLLGTCLRQRLCRPGQLTGPLSQDCPGVRRDEQWIGNRRFALRIPRLRDGQAARVHGEPELRVARIEQQQGLLVGAFAAQPQGQGGRLKVLGRRAGADQPRVTPADLPSGAPGPPRDRPR